jgi:hypothetical protein
MAEQIEMTADLAIALVRAELARAEAKHHAFHSGHEGYAVIREELDELWDGIKADKQYASYGGSTAYEAVQVAAMALRFLVNLCDVEDLRAYIAGRHQESREHQPELFHVEHS